MSEENGKKKRRQTGYRLYQQKDNGILYDKNEARFPLPEVGDFVIIEEKYVYTRGKDDWKIKAVYKPSDSYISGYGFPLVFEVVEITHPEDPLKGLIKLEARFKGRDHVHRATVSKKDVSIGFRRLAKQESGEQLRVKISTSYANSMIAEFSPFYRKRNFGDGDGVSDSFDE